MVWFVARFLLLHVAWIAAWADGLPTTLHVGGMGLPLQTIIVATEHPQQAVATVGGAWEDWIKSILARFP